MTEKDQDLALCEAQHRIEELEAEVLALQGQLQATRHSNAGTMCYLLTIAAQLADDLTDELEPR